MRPPSRPLKWIGTALSTTLCLGLVGCGVEPGPSEDVLGVSQQPLVAYCEANVEGSGVVAVEDDYLPHVVACENGAADFAALQAQAVAARSYLYYKLGRQGSIADGTGDQVYTCGRPPGPQHFEAAESTRGQVLRYRGTLIAAFYVAGAIPSTADCRPAAGDRDPTSTEQWVTYNEGRSGDDLEQTQLGWVDPGNLANRGCKSQNGANCLSRAGRSYEEILHFYYGEDIELVTAEGACVEPPPPPPDRPTEPPPPEPDARVLEADAAVPDALVAEEDAASADALPPEADLAAQGVDADLSALGVDAASRFTPVLGEEVSFRGETCASTATGSPTVSSLGALSVILWRLRRRRVPRA